MIRVDLASITDAGSGAPEEVAIRRSPAGVAHVSTGRQLERADRRPASGPELARCMSLLHPRLWGYDALNSVLQRRPHHPAEHPAGRALSGEPRRPARGAGRPSAGDRRVGVEAWKLGIKLGQDQPGGLPSTIRLRNERSLVRAYRVVAPGATLIPALARSRAPVRAAPEAGREQAGTGSRAEAGGRQSQRGTSVGGDRPAGRPGWRRDSDTTRPGRQSPPAISQAAA